MSKRLQLESIFLMLDAYGPEGVANQIKKVVKGAPRREIPN